MIVNWLVRVRNKDFWLTFVPATLVFIKAVAAIFGLELDFGDLGNRILVAVEAAFIFLACLGVVNDPTTATLSDSPQALGYVRPKVS